MSRFKSIVYSVLICITCEIINFICILLNKFPILAIPVIKDGIHFRIGFGFVSQKVTLDWNGEKVILTEFNIFVAIISFVIVYIIIRIIGKMQEKKEMLMVGDKNE